jgi:hypothetical protein
MIEELYMNFSGKKFELKKIRNMTIIYIVSLLTQRDDEHG